MSESASDDPRIAFVYQEGLRGLLQQQSAVESLHNRAATLVFAASFASSRDISVFIVPRMAHMHNFASTRERLWDRIVAWSKIVAISKGNHA